MRDRDCDASAHAPLHVVPGRSTTWRSASPAAISAGMPRWRCMRWNSPGSALPAKRDCAQGLRKRRMAGTVSADRRALRPRWRAQSRRGAAARRDVAREFGEKRATLVLGILRTRTCAGFARRCSRSPGASSPCLCKIRARRQRRRSSTPSAASRAAAGVHGGAGLCRAAIRIAASMERRTLITGSLFSRRRGTRAFPCGRTAGDELAVRQVNFRLRSRS